MKRHHPKSTPMIMAVAPESIAGEKERGSIATLLVTPVRRSELAIGKIVSLSVAALLSGLSSFAGTMLSMPKLMGLSSDQLSAAAYGVREYALLLAVVLSTVLLVIALISIISAAARSVKEAGTTVSPLMLLVTLAVGVAIDPSFVTTLALPMKVITSEHNYARTIGDKMRLNEPHPNVKVAINVNQERFVPVFMNHLTNLLANH